MLVKTKAIVLSSLKYQEKSLIVKCFTESDGLKSYFVPSAYSNKKVNQKIAYFQPLTIIEIEANHKNIPSIPILLKARLLFFFPKFYITPSKKKKKTKVYFPF
jgi:DNA repair protein RecO (recombination protein O)